MDLVVCTLTDFQLPCTRVKTSCTRLEFWQLEANLFQFLKRFFLGIKIILHTWKLQRKRGYSSIDLTMCICLPPANLHGFMGYGYGTKSLELTSFLKVPYDTHIGSVIKYPEMVLIARTDWTYNVGYNNWRGSVISYPDLTLSLEMWDLVKFDFEHAQCQRGPKYGLFFHCACWYSLLWFWVILRNKNGFREYSWRVKGISFYRNCGAASVGEWYTKIWFINGVDNVNWPPYRDWKADVSRVSPSSERIDELWVV